MNLTDNEIIKALGCCADYITLEGCKDCPLKDRECGTTENLCEYALDLINRQKADIKRLQNILLAFMDEVAKWENKKGLDVSDLPLIPICDERRNIIDHYKAEAIKEFEKLLIDNLIHERYGREFLICLIKELSEGIRGATG